MSLAPSPLDWMSLLSPAAATTEKSLIREMFIRLRKGNIASFAGGMPDTALFPYAHMQSATQHILDDKAQRITALNYGPSEGYLPLRQWIANHMQGLGVKCESDNILITSGGQQGLDLICRSMLTPGDKVIVAAPTYLGALQILRTYSADILSVPTDEDGPLLDQFEIALEANPKFIYLVSDFSNPSGQTISKQRRTELIKVARSKGVPIVDDAAYQQLRYQGDPIVPMMACDQQASSKQMDDPLQDGGVIHVGTFSKTMMPGLRVGWIVAPKPFLQAVIPLKQATDLHSPLLNQMATHKVVSTIYDSHIETLRRAYSIKRTHMIEAMKHHLPRDVKFNKPEGGMFVWVTLTEGHNSTDLLDSCLDEAKVAYIPGGPFFSNAEQGKLYCRFSFSGSSEQKINEGIERFGKFISNKI